MVIVESCDYRFDFGQEGTVVVFSAVRVDGDDITDEDERWVKERLKDMGKWEAVVKAFSDLVGEAGLSKASPSIKAFSPDAYKVETQPKGKEVVRGTVSLSKEERHRRTGGSVGMESALSVEEVIEQMENVGKWRNLQRAISSVRLQ